MTLAFYDALLNLRAIFIYHQVDFLYAIWASVLLVCM
jgi:hypothetical protein